ncbi:uncharacterized protein K02A2.6-like [Macrosteles quadrilineatus]|uniref:uncharacterized protein K02A2.6-like n=1 Tax=Macrosteles quadrilineatus TaxID=74068 RepID=UPI0023E13069|nr:uncharacterized protein K02A2.6-like [Macrosteles quadrilineatus]
MGTSHKKSKAASNLQLEPAENQHRVTDSAAASSLTLVLISVDRKSRSNKNLARPIPYSLKQKVETELERLETAGIITKTDNSEWGTPIVPVMKPNGEIRICADYKVTVNRQIQDEHYPIPRIEDIFANMSGGKIFCTLDLKKAYLHLQMDEASADIQTLSTHKGQFRVNRLMFGVKVAPGIWQRIMYKVLSGIEGTQCFFDEIIIQGKSEEELLTRLEMVLQRIKMNGLRLNRDKCKFLHKQIEYLGHTIDAHGIHKSEDKVKAIRQARRPRNVVDAFSKWVEVIPTKNITSSWTIRELRKIFTTFGLPSVIVSDNGRQFTSSEFSNFLKKCGTLHKMTAPYHPSSNGQVERFVQTIKKLINCMSDEPGTLEEKLHQLLMKLRQAPNSTDLGAELGNILSNQVPDVLPRRNIRRLFKSCSKAVDEVSESWYGRRVPDDGVPHVPG